jgi:hypothetical protein
MGTWATWTFTRFERVKVRVYSTCKQGFGSLPHTGYNVAYFPTMQDRHEAKQGEKRHSTVASYGWSGSVARLVATVASFLLCPSPLGFIYGAYFFGPANGGLDHDQNRS